MLKRTDRLHDPAVGKIAKYRELTVLNGFQQSNQIISVAFL